MPAASPSVPREFLGHPVGLYVCFLTEMWERFSYYGMRALLLLYLTKYHLFSDDHGYNLVGAYGGLVYAMPVIGGLLADRYLGMRKSVLLGGVLLVLGHFGMAFEGHAATVVDGEIARDIVSLRVFYLSLALIVVGVGFLKPNISTIVGKLYRGNDPRRDSGFTIFYAGINVGAVLATLVCGWLGERYGWRYGFGAAGVGMLVGLSVFLLGQRHLMGHAEPPDAARLRERVAFGLTREQLIYAGSLVGVALIWLLIQMHSAVIPVIPGAWSASPVVLAMHAVTTVFSVSILWFLFRHCTRVQRQQMSVLVALIGVALLFFTLYEQTGGSWILFSDRSLERHTSLLGWSVEWTASQLYGLGSVFVILLAPFFAWLWPRLERAGMNPSTPAKSGLGLVFAGLAFVVLSYASRHPENSGLVGLGWFVLAYFVLELGEMLLSPVGLSAVTQLSVPRVLGVMMGAWWLGTSYSEVMAAHLGKLSSIQIPEGAVINVADALTKYDQLWVYSAKIGIGCGVAVLVLTPLMRRWMHGVK